MKYLDQKAIEDIGVNWKQTIKVIEDAISCLGKNDFSQPIKPYLRYNNPENRIIAMPAYLGGKFHIAGIKWIASFPKNITKGIPRAHSVVILNEADTGIPIATINTPLISIIRTASVTGTVLSLFQKARKMRKITIGIIGWGPIGQNHYAMCLSLFGKHIEKIVLFDIRPINIKTIPPAYRAITHIATTWQEAYENMDIVITCTVSKKRYINKLPKKGALLLNVSLRDYKPSMYRYVKKGIIVDDWEEVCRENTDIEKMHIQKGLQKKNTFSLVDIFVKNKYKEIPQDRTIMFNPMGMAIFDMAIAKYYFNLANKLGKGKNFNS